MKIFRLVFFCDGNTCRSPMAEMILKFLLKQRNFGSFKISSAGLSAYENDPMNESAKAALKANGIPRTVFKTKRINADGIKKADVVICMTEAQKRELSFFPNVVSFSEIANEEIRDPYGENYLAYGDVCAKLIEKMPEIINYLLKNFDLGEIKK